jgi:uncharacterized repeat protein (TIGR01451 family)
MSQWHDRLIAVAGLALLLTAGAADSSHAQVGRGELVVTVSESIDPVPGGGELAYGVSVKNTGSIRAKKVVVTVPIGPAGLTFVKCTTSSATPPLQPCGVVGDSVVTKFQYIPAHKTATLNVTVKVPKPDAQTQISLKILANGDQADDGDATVTTTILGSGSTGTFLPSGRTVNLSCGMELNFSAFKPSAGTPADHTLRLNKSLGCATAPVGLRIAASNKTLDLNGFKIVGSSSGPTGSAGVVVAVDKVNVTIRGGNVGGNAGIEHFDWCVIDEGGNAGLAVDTLRCFRGRSAGIDLMSSNVTVRNSLVDRATFATKNTFEPPGGVGIRVTGDNVLIRDTIVRRSQNYGIWATGVDTDGDGNAVTIESTAGAGTPAMRVESSIGIGIRADGQRLRVKDVRVSGDWKPDDPDGGAKSTVGVVVEATATETVLDGVRVKEFGADGFLIAGPGTRVTNSRVEEVAADGFVATGDGVLLQNNEARTGRHGYVLSGPNVQANNNLAEEVGGDGYVVGGFRVQVLNSEAKEGAGHGFVVEGTEVTLRTNVAEKNAGDGYHITGATGLYENNDAKTNTGMGLQITGPSNTFRTNTSEKSGGLGWSIGPNNVDGGSNEAGGDPCTFAIGPTSQTCEDGT